MSKPQTKAKALTPAEQRVAIATDALAWIEAGALKPAVGSYVTPTRWPDPDDDGKQLRDVVLGKCRVCALGAMMLAKAVRFDGCLARGHGTFIARNVRDRLSEHFDRQQLALIEVAFERCSLHALRRDDVAFAALDFGCRYGNDRRRLVAILENIIANNGTFVP